MREVSTGDRRLGPIATSSTPGPGKVPGQCPDSHCENDLDQVVFAREWGSGLALPPSPAQAGGPPHPVGLPERKAPSSSNISLPRVPDPSPPPPPTGPLEEQTLQAFTSPCLRETSGRGAKEEKG